MKLGNVVKLQAGSGFKQSMQGRASGEIPFIKQSDMSLSLNSRRIIESNNWVSFEDLKMLRAKPLPAGTTVFGKIGEGLKRNRYRQLVRPTIVDNNMMGAVPTDLIDPDFLYFMMCTIDLGSISEGSALPYLRTSDVADIPILLPTLAEQRAVAEVLGSFDSKIESNRRVATTGAELCDYLLISLDTEPVPLHNVASVTMGSSPPGSTYNETGEGLPFYQGVRDFGERFPSRRVWCTEPVRSAVPGSTLVSVRAPIGRLNRATEECCIGRGLAGIKAQRSDALVYYALRAASDAWVPFESEGTVFGAIKRGDLEAVEVHWPKSDQKGASELLLESVDKIVGLALTESEHLGALRDILLPELISGRLRVPAVKEMIDAI
jgi:type I restriction enzyme S subunit